MGEAVLRSLSERIQGKKRYTLTEVNRERYDILQKAYLFAKKVWKKEELE